MAEEKLIYVKGYTVNTYYVKPHTRRRKSKKSK
jgi:hypothetical protein